jgi:hypothetical protein
MSSCGVGLLPKLGFDDVKGQDWSMLRRLSKGAMVLDPQVPLEPDDLVGNFHDLLLAVLNARCNAEQCRVPVCVHLTNHTSLPDPWPQTLALSFQASERKICSLRRGKDNKWQCDCGPENHVCE